MSVWLEQREGGEQGRLAYGALETAKDKSDSLTYNGTKSLELLY